MSRKIIGVTVGTPLSPNKIKEKIDPELTSAVNAALAQAKAEMVNAVLAALPVYNGEVESV